MKYSIKVNEVKGKGKQEDTLRGFATVVFGDSFKITNIAVLKNGDTGKLFVSMPRYKSNDKDENGGVIYKDVCNPITAEFREELYSNILEEYNRLVAGDNKEAAAENETVEPLKFSVTVTPFTKENSNIRGLARIYFDDRFIVNNVNLLQGKEKIFIAMPSYKTKQVDEQGRAVYQDVCYPVTKEFREKLYGEIERIYNEALEMQKHEVKNKSKSKNVASQDHRQSKDKFVEAETTPFR